MKFKLISIFAGILILLVIFLISSNYFSLSELTTSSPNKLYNVSMKQTHDHNEEYVVKFNVTKNEKPFLENEFFYHDSGTYIQRGLVCNWNVEKILICGTLNQTPSTKPDEISVINQTNKVISYLKINAVEKILLLDVLPQTTTKILTYPQTDKVSDISWIGAVGKFEDGKHILYSGANFRIRGKYVASSHYFIFISDDDLEVQSKEYEGFKPDISGNEVDVKLANSKCH